MIPDAITWGTLTLYQECAQESPLGKLAVAYVIMNRSNKWNRPVSDIVLDKYQFSCWNTESGTRLFLDTISSSAWRECHKAFVTAYYAILPDPTNGATHYLNEKLTRKIRGGTLPAWFKEANVTLREGLHTFLKV